jgi:ubiquinone/menaquinone biosynthesis C-methylase UbiE
MALFRLGDVSVTKKASAALSGSGWSAEPFLARHQAGDWGEVETRVAHANQFAVERGQTIYSITSRYPIDADSCLLVMTSPDQSSTLVLLASEMEVHEVGVAEGYARWAEFYDLELNPLIDVEGPLVESIVRDIPMESAIDVGAGTGRHTLALASRGVAVTAVDPSLEMLAMARQKAEASGLNIDFRLAAIEEGLPSEDSQFDFLICALTLCHVMDIAQAVRECARVVRSGGSILITDIHPDAVNGLNWGAKLRRPGATYILPNVGHTRSDYLDAIAAAGCSLMKLVEIPVRDAPVGTIVEWARHEFSDRQYCLIVLARKG